MSQIDCSACQTIQEISPDFAQNGVTTTVATSLKNNTGFNPSAGRDDCEDLNDANDCLVGRMDGELEAFEMCNWKKFMHKFLPNLYELLKAIIAAICGIWTKAEKVDDICALLDATIQPPAQQYGTLKGTTNYDASREGGRIENDLLYDPDLTQPATNVGLYIATLRATNCEGVCKRHVWVKPDIHFYFLANEANYGDTLWSVEHEKAVEWGIPEGLYDLFRRYPQYFIGYTDVFGDTSVVTLGIYVDETEDRLQVRYLGCTGDMHGKKFNSTSTVNYYHYVTGC